MSALKTIVLASLASVIGCNGLPRTSGENKKSSDINWWADNAATDVSQTTTMKPAGGEISAATIVLSFPANAISEPTEIVIKSTDKAPKGYLGIAYEVELGEKLSEPVELTFHLPISQVPAPYKYSELKLGYVNAEGAWEVLENSQADEASETVSGTTTHLSIWGVLPKVKLDILWVIDSSASMCKQQVAMPRIFNEFVTSTMVNLPRLDLHVAATTMDGLSLSSQHFNYNPASAFPPACYGHIYFPCLEDEDCNEEFGGNWECKAPMNPDAMYNLNGSVNSTCRMVCEDATECCPHFCPDNTCDDVCKFSCKSAGRGGPNPGCMPDPMTDSCPVEGPKVLTNQDLDLFNCLVTTQPDQSYQANLEQGFKAAWQALDPDGKNSELSQFSREDAFLLMVFVTDEEDCSIGSHYASPSYTCETDADCLNGAGICEENEAYSEFIGQTVKLCHGIIKKDYYNNCALLGEYKDSESYALYLDPNGSQCVADTDCQEGFECTDNNRCIPFGSTPPYATFDNPIGSPLFSLSSVDKMAERYKSLKPDSTHVMITAIAGDGMVLGSDEDSLISEACLGMAELTACAEYKAAKDNASETCKTTPMAEGCESFSEAKLACIRACYLASKNNPENMSSSKNTYICTNPTGKFDLGLRYIRLVEQFGDQGTMSNLCDWKNPTTTAQKLYDLILGNVL
jgi:hypothetical protein